MSRDTQLSKVPIELALKFLESLSLPPSLPLMSTIFSLSSIRNQCADKRSPSNIPQTHRHAEKRKTRFVFSRNSASGLSLEVREAKRSHLGKKVNRSPRSEALRTARCEYRRSGPKTMNRISIVDDTGVPKPTFSVLPPRFSSSFTPRVSAATVTFAVFPIPTPRFVGDSRDKKIATSYPSKRYFCIRFVLENGAYASANAHEFPGRCLARYFSH